MYVPSQGPLDATAIVGCAISLFFCVVSVVAFIFFRPRTEAFLIKQHLVYAVGLTQIVLLVSIGAYEKEEGCEAISVVLHYSASSCFTWCLVDSLYLYFNHTNSANPLRRNVFYLLLGWGFPLIVLGMSLAIGFTTSSNSKEPVLSLYECWDSDHIVWTFVVPALLIATLNLMVLCVTLHHLRQPSYDICARAVVEKRCTRYGLRTNSLMLLGLCLGWIFGILSFHKDKDVVFQLSFGLVNGLQGIFLFFFHCVLNIDIKAYYQSGVHRCSHEDGCLTDRERSRRVNAQAQDPTGSRRKISTRSHAQDNIPLISVRAQSSSNQDENSAVSPLTAPKAEPQPLEVTVESKRESPPVEEEAAMERAPSKPDHDAYPSLPGTPEPHISEFEVKQPKRQSTPPDQLVSKRAKEVEGIDRRSATPTSLSNYKPLADDRTENYPPSHPAENLRVHQRAGKSRSESAIPGFDLHKPAQKHYSTHVDSKSDDRKLSVQSSHSTGSSEKKPRRTSRTTQSTPLNELESLFSNPYYVKPQRPSVSSLYGPGGGDRNNSYETVQGSRTSSRNTEETML